jgi:methyl-accepting chemotaxis protein
MDQVTQGTAASAEEGASAAEELSAQAESMQHSVRKLSRLVDRDDDSSVARTPPAAPAAMSAKRAPVAPARRALSSVVAKPAPYRAIASSSALHTPVAIGDTPTDAQFLESFEEM